MTPVMELKRWTKLTENQQNNVTIHENFNQL